jgi:hypothetical protein
MASYTSPTRAAYSASFHSSLFHLPANRHSHGGTGCGAAHKPFRPSRASASNPSRTTGTRREIGLGKLPYPHACFEYGSCEAVVSPGTVSADKIASCTHCNAMETCLTIDGGNPASHAARTGGSPLKNSRGNSSHYSSVPRRVPALTPAAPRRPGLILTDNSPPLDTPLLPLLPRY